jgi:WD40 repeat protein/transcriptional regulator with XRE-family HTH domain
MEVPVGALLREHRLARGITQEALAERAGISARSIQAIERGTTKPLKDTVQRLADALTLADDDRSRLLDAVTPAPRRRFSPAASSIGAPWTGVLAGESELIRSTAVDDRRVTYGAVPGVAAIAASVPRNPYKGLRAFRGEDAGDFFGRELLIAELAAAIEDYTQPGATRFLAVVGPSGSGKSSVVLAGLVPHLRGGAVPGSTRWVYLAPLVPGVHPLEALSVALANALPQSTIAALRSDLDSSERGLHLLAGRLTEEPASRVVLVVDQAEELFTLTSVEEERRQFIDLLVTAASEPRGPVAVVLTLRADFFDRPMSYSQFGRLVAGQSVVVMPMEPAELQAAIERPAAQLDVGLRFEAGLVGHLLHEVQGTPGALPLVQFTLDQLYERRDGRLMTESAYHAIGGVRGALARHAEATFQSLPSEPHRALARALFLRLIEPGTSALDTTRRRARLAELELADPARTVLLREVAEVFIGARLLVTLESGGVTTLEVSHEALIREWARLDEWLHDAREDVRLQGRISGDAAQWAGLGRPADSLYRGVVLAEAREWEARNTPSALEVAFLEASAAEGRRQGAVEHGRQAHELTLARRAAIRLRILVGVLALFLLVATGLTVLALSSADQAKVARQQAVAASDVALSRQLAAQAITRSTSQYDLSLLLGLEARRAANTVEARASQLQGMEAAPAGLTAFLRGHVLGVNSVAISRDGTILASGSEDGTIRLWNARQRRALGPPLVASAGPIWGVAFSPDGTLLASGDDNGTVRLWSVARQRALGPPVHAHIGPATPLAFSPDGRTLASVGDDGLIVTWDVTASGTLNHSSFVAGCASGAQSWALAISANGKILANGCTDGAIALWSVAGTGLTRLGSLTGHIGPVFGVAFSPDGQTLASAASDHTVRLWDVARQQQIGTPLIGHTGDVITVAFSPDGSTLASGSLDGTARLWDVRRRRLLGPPLMAHTGDVNSVVFSPDGATLAAGTADGSVALWALRRRQPPSSTLGSGPDAMSIWAFSGDGKRLVSASPHGAEVRVWTLNGGTLAPGRLIVVGVQVSSVAFSPDDQLLVIGEGGIVQLRDVASGQLLDVPNPTQGSGIDQLAFSPDGKVVASAGDDGTIQLWSVTAGPHRSLHPLGVTLAGSTAAVQGLAFSPDGKVLASGGADAVIRLWDVARRRLLGPPLIGHLAAVTAVAFSPDGKILASSSSDRTVRLWDVARRRQIGQALIGHTDDVLNVAFSPDGTILASGSSDHSVRLWDVASGQPLGGPLSTGQGGFVSSMAFTGDGTTLVTGNYDLGTVQLLDIDLPTWPRRACQLANRNLTQQEWRQYLGALPYHKTCQDLPTGT